MKNTQPLSACCGFCKKPFNENDYFCSKCGVLREIATPEQPITFKNGSTIAFGKVEDKDKLRGSDTPSTSDDDWDFNEKISKALYKGNILPVHTNYGVGADMVIIDGKLRKEIANLIRAERENTKKAYGGCKLCYGKAYATYRHGLKYSADMLGDKEYIDPMETHMNFCSCDRGKQLKELVTAERERILEAVKLEKKTSNVLPAYTDGWNAAINYLNAIREKIKKNI